ncbi:MAG: GNAT family N-acetyltransferase [Planctomycetaceae bacterium]|nr:GNAT family N-acetyltransferase [Planctomycetaceae bacterium]
MDDRSVRIVIADTDALRESAFRLRYDVFFLENGDDRHADHTKKQWIDEDDIANSHIVVALNEHEAAVGTSRVTFLRDHEFIASELYAFDRLAGVLNMATSQLTENIWRWDRGGYWRRIGNLVSSRKWNVLFAGSRKTLAV